MHKLTVVAIAAGWLSAGGLGAPAFAGNYGAFAYAPSSGAYGTAWDLASRADAENAAMANCAAQSGGCEVAVWFVDACGALATGNGGGWGSGWGNSRRRAESEALNVCGKYAAGCGVLAWACTSR